MGKEKKKGKLVGRQNPIQSIPILLLPPTVARPHCLLLYLF